MVRSHQRHRLRGGQLDHFSEAGRYHLRCRGGPAWAGAVRFLITDHISGSTPNISLHAAPRSPAGGPPASSEAGRRGPAGIVCVLRPLIWA